MLHTFFAKNLLHPFIPMRAPSAAMAPQCSTI